MTERELRELVAGLHDELAATEELDVNYEANRWLGEAQAVVADALGPDVPASVVEKRVGQAEELLENVDDTRNPRADEHVEAAIELAVEIQERL